MLNWLAVISVAIVLLAPVGDAVAQSSDYVIQPSGQPQTTLKPGTTGDDLVIQRPGRPPLYAKPRPDGSYSVDVPGQPPTTMTPRPGGGFVI